MNEAPDAPLRIMLVDDDPLVLMTLKRALAAEGHQVVATNDPRKVVGMLATDPADVLISDLDMPGLSGLALLAQVRQEHPAVVRILLTGAATLNSALDAINKGEVFRYLTKPWRSDELRTAIGDAAARAKEERLIAIVASADQRRAGLLAAIEEAFPGVTRVERVEGAYVVEADNVARGLAHFEGEGVSALWKS
jgi:DNA-binding NtrC family response regulator